MADTGCFGFLIPALLFRIWSCRADRRRLALSSKNWPAKVSRERRTELRDGLACHTRVVFRQRRNAIGNIVMLGAIELIGRPVSGAIVLQGPQHSSADDKQGNRAPSRQNLPRQPCHTRMLRS